jgi:kynurenine formamidase
MKTSVVARCGSAMAAVLVMTAIAGGQEQSPRPWRRILDLTHTLSDGFPFIPVPGITFPFSLTPIATLDKNGVAANRWNIHEHIGTQIDAPNHFAAGGKGLDTLAAESLVVPLAVIDVRTRAGADADATVTVDDIAAWERRHGRLPENAAVFMYSGWDARIADARAFINADAAQTMHFPGFSSEAAAFLLNERVVAGIGVDTLSIDPGVDTKFRTHALWLGGGKWAVEAVANLGQAPPVGATVFVGAPKVKDATGGPVRLLAVW